MIPLSELELYRRLSPNFNIVFDVGSSDDIHYYDIHPNCEYHLFEPNKESLISLNSKLEKLNNHRIIVNEYGLSDKNEDNRPYFNNTQSFTINYFVKEIHTGEKYSLRTLDDYVQDNKISNIDFLKLDVEGLEYNILIGGQNIINKTSVIQIEYSGGIRQYVDLLYNFDTYLLMEPILLGAINRMNSSGINFDNSLTYMTDTAIQFIDNVVSPTGNGGNILCINKNYPLDINTVMFKI